MSATDRPRLGRGRGGQGPTRLGRRSSVVLLAALGAGTLLVTGSRAWVSGTVNDAVLGSSTVTATGAEVAPGLSALALVLAAAAIAAVTGGRVVRTLAVALLGAAVALLAFLLVRVVADPAGLLGPVAAASVGRTGSLRTDAAVTAWPWVGWAGTALAALGVVGAVLGSSTWGAPPARYERTAAAGSADATGATSTGPRGQRVSSDWDRLSAGIDPTDVGEDTQT